MTRAAGGRDVSKSVEEDGCKFYQLIIILIKMEYSKVDMH